MQRQCGSLSRRNLARSCYAFEELPSPSSAWASSPLHGFASLLSCLEERLPRGLEAEAETETQTLPSGSQEEDLEEESTESVVEPEPEPMKVLEQSGGCSRGLGGAPTRAITALLGLGGILGRRYSEAYGKRAGGRSGAFLFAVITESRGWNEYWIGGRGCGCAALRCAWEMHLRGRCPRAEWRGEAARGGKEAQTCPVRVSSGVRAPGLR